jgi:amino acid transporter
MATLFFEHLFDDQVHARRAMAALIAVSIFGNLVVMTFTAARVKQEIAKEGILPKSLIFATSYTTPYGLWKKWMSRNTILPEDLEHAPTAAFVLHWFTSILLILVTLPVGDPRKAYSALVSLFSYTIVTLLGCWVSVGLLWVKLRRGRWHWQERRRYRPWLSPAHAIIYSLVSAFVLITAFAPPPLGSPFHSSVTGFEWYIVPAIGISAPLWGMIWYVGLLIYQRITDHQLVVHRTPFWMKDPHYPSEYIQQAEIIDHTWQITPRRGLDSGFEGSEEPKDGATTGQREADPFETSSEEGGGGQKRWRWNRGGRTTTMTDGRRLSDGFEG